MKTTGKLSNLQLELVKLFKYDLDEKQLSDIRKLLSDYFAAQATQNMDKFMSENDLDEHTIDMWANERMRTKK